MSQFLPINAEDGSEFYIEVLPADGQSGITRRSRDVSEKLTNAEFKQMIRQAVMPACRTFVDVWQDLNQPLTADSAEVEFNLGFTASGSAVIVQAAAQASFKVKVSWKFGQPKISE
jgi:Trypsin-co-occurring domain 1